VGSVGPFLIQMKRLTNLDKRLTLFQRCPRGHSAAEAFDSLFAGQQSPGPTFRRGRATCRFLRFIRPANTNQA